MHEFDAHIVVSEPDRTHLVELGANAKVFLIENGVDTDYYSDERIERVYTAWRSANADAGISSPETRRVVFVGSMDYHANIDGVVQFAREAWPALQELHPELTFTIVGRDPSAEVMSLASLAGIEVTGTVDDVRPYYREAVAAIVPLRVGGGSRLKILEAMAAGVPVVSTSLGAEGIEVRDRENILLAESDEDLCDAIVSIDADVDLRQKLIVAGRTLVSERYDWSTLGSRLFDTYQSLLD